MALPCGKRPVTLVFCICECVFISGLLNGWVWMQQILKDEGYYADTCNVTRLSSSKSENTGGMIGFLSVRNEGTKDMHKDIKGKHCKYVRVNKIVTLTEYAEMKRKKEEVIKNNQTFDSNKTVPDCSTENGGLDFVITVAVVSRNIFMFPLGIFLDKYGTTRARIIAM